MTTRLCSPFLSDSEISRILKGSDVWMDSDGVRQRLMRMQRALAQGGRRRGAKKD